MKLIKLFFPVLLFLGIIEQGYPMEENPDSFDPVKIAQRETELWKAYYAKDSDKISENLKVILEQVYAMLDATSALPLYLQAVGAFGQMPQDAQKEEYKQKILPLLTKAFKEIKKTSTYSSFNPELLAEKELEWWVARRIPTELDIDNVSAIMAQAYALLYGSEAKTYGRVAFLKASAARYRDECQDRWGGVKDDDWGIIQGMLIQSYTQLKSVLPETEQRGK